LGTNLALGVRTCERRRIQQNCVFPEKTALRPADVHEKGNERLTDRLGRRNANHRPGTLLLDFKCQVIQKTGPVEAKTLEGGGRGQLDAELFQLFGRVHRDRNLGNERLVERRP
jgi:hypothetical protein